MNPSLPSASGQLPSTQWTLIDAMRRGGQASAQQAWDWFAHTYWSPIYGFIRHQGRAHQDACDLTQGFFCHIIKHGLVEKADPERGRLRTLVLAALRNFLISDWERATAAKRGGTDLPLSINEAEAEAWYGAEPVDRLSPDALFNRRWALTLLQEALSAVGKEYAERGQRGQFELLSPIMMHEQASVGAKPMSSAQRVALHRLRERYREKLRELASQFLDCPTDQAVAEELRFLLTSISQ